MEKNNKLVYPSWYWLWNYRVRYIARGVTGILFLLIIYGLLRGRWYFNILLLPAFFLLAVTATDQKFKRGNIPSRIRRRMLEHYTGKIHTAEAFYILERVYERAATISPMKPQDLWLTKHYFVAAFNELAKLELDDPKEYDQLKEYIINRYY